jgi:hypothetical protein
MTFKEQIEIYLAPLPSEWREKLTAILCEINASQQTVNCDDVKDCETLTSLSAFSIQGTNLSIQYRDEDQVNTTRTVNLENVINQTLEDIDPNCLTSEVTWASMTYTQRLQLLIDSHCDCCD